MSDLRAEVAQLTARGDHRAAWGALATAVQAKPTSATCHLVCELLDAIDPARAGLTELRVAVLTNYTAVPLAPVLTARALPWGLHLRTFVSAFNTWMQEIVDPGSELRRFEPQVVVLDLLPDLLVPSLCREFLSLDHAGVERAVDAGASAVIEAVQSLRAWSTARILAHSLPRPFGPALGILDAGPLGQRAAFARLNHQIETAVSGTDTYLVDTDRLVAEVGAGAWRDARHWATATVPYTPAAMHRIAEEHLRYLRAFSGRVRKVLVLDLDDTLWGGVLGERGEEGIDLGDTYPGNGFVDFQQAIAELRWRGVVLALNSSNDEAEAMRVIESHPSMVLRLDAFAARRINWHDKVANIEAIAGELGLGLDSFVFIDNSEAECARMRQALPEVLTWQLGSEPAGYGNWLRMSGAFDSLSYSDEDRHRGALYRGEAARAQHRQAVGSLEDYLVSLDMELRFEPVGPSTLARAADLTQRTNQFNMTTRRMTVDQVREWTAAPGRAAYVITLTDRFGPQGIVAFAALDGSSGSDVRISDFLVSCRVLKRGVEHAILGLLIAQARDRGGRMIVGEVRATPRNEAFVNFYRDAGFAPINDTQEFGWPLDRAYAAPAHIRIGRSASPQPSIT